MGQKLGSDIIKPLQYSAPNVILPSGSRVTIGGQQYLTTTNLSVALSGLAAVTLYFVYASVSGSTVSLSYSTSVPSANTNKKLVGAFYSNGLTSPSFGSFVNIKGTPVSETIPFTQSIVASVNPSKSNSNQDAAYFRRNGDKLEVEWHYRSNGTLTGASSGTGAYSWVLPGTLSIDYANKMLGAAGTGTPAVLGYIWAGGGAQTYQDYHILCGGVGSPTLVAANRDGGSGNLGSSERGLASDANISYGMSYAAPIVGWNTTSLEDL